MTNAFGNEINGNTSFEMKMNLFKYQNISEYIRNNPLNWNRDKLNGGEKILQWNNGGHPRSGARTGA